MSVFNFFEQTKLAVKGHILAPLWWSRDRRRHWRSKIRYEIIEAHCKPYLVAVAKLKDVPIIKNDKDEKVFSLWLQGEKNAPPLVKSCFRSMKKYLKQAIVILDEKTLFNYIDLPAFIMEKHARGQIGNAHFSDIARVELLHNHGGFWLDSTSFVSAPISKEIEEQDFFMYLWQKPSDFSYGFIQNCFIRASRGSYLLAAWRAIIHEYWKHENAAHDYFIHQILFKILVNNDPRAKKYFNEMLKLDQDPTHRLWHYHNRPFDRDLFHELTRCAFFQKTRYADTVNVIDGSFADAIIKM